MGTIGFANHLAFIACFISIYKSITMFYGIEDIPQNIHGYSPHTKLNVGNIVNPTKHYYGSE